MARKKSEGLEPKTDRDYLILLWNGHQEVIKRLDTINNYKNRVNGKIDGLDSRLTKVEERQGILAGIQGLFTVLVGAIAGYFGAQK